jgi:hypothetical protein
MGETGQGQKKPTVGTEVAANKRRLRSVMNLCGGNLKA